MSTLLLNRRQWLKAAGATLAATALAPRMQLQAQAPVPRRAAPPVEPGMIQLSWNENPFGPAPSAQAAMIAAVPLSCRYPDAEEVPFTVLVNPRLAL